MTRHFGIRMGFQDTNAYPKERASAKYTSDLVERQNERSGGKFPQIGGWSPPLDLQMSSFQNLGRKEGGKMKL